MHNKNLEKKCGKKNSPVMTKRYKILRSKLNKKKHMRKLHNFIDGHRIRAEGTQNIIMFSDRKVLHCENVNSLKIELLFNFI